MKRVSYLALLLSCCAHAVALQWMHIGTTQVGSPDNVALAAPNLTLYQVTMPPLSVPTLTQPAIVETPPVETVPVETVPIIEPPLTAIETRSVVPRDNPQTEVTQELAKEIKPVKPVKPAKPPKPIKPAVPPKNQTNQTAASAHQVSSAHAHSTTQSPSSGDGKQLARLIQSPKPCYPRVSRTRGEQGVVVVDIHIDQQGQATQVVVKKSTGYARLDQCAVQAMQQGQFAAASHQQQPIKSVLTRRIAFRLEDAQ